MAVVVSTESTGAVFQIPVHFDVRGTGIALDTFVETARQVDALIAGLNRDLLESQLQYKIIVLPPEAGSFLSRLGVIVVAGAGVFLAFIESDSGRGFRQGAYRKGAK